MTTLPYENIYPKENEGCSLFSKCCFCIPLKTGCFILGYISVTLNFFITLFYIGTLSFLAFYTHGFRYIRLKKNADGQMVPDSESMDKSRLGETVAVLFLVGFLNIAWFLMNIVLLIGLHRKRPGHIKLHVSVAAVRLALSIGGVVMYGPHHTSHSMFVCCGEIALTAYFILIYYMYAVQLERELRPSEPRDVSDIVADVLSGYPQNIDKINLTEKNDKSFITA
ncbi:hypothetical protein PYW07_006744 [Mythimna separata]|uniref:Uncharacterized protein n=1 Tax=Mythimna separata TaxID=271217 RepID=A0AAD8DX18_MYTSE|nr:hypothetical protein PYW07_006744 [Mythimna separata]